MSASAWCLSSTNLRNLKPRLNRQPREPNYWDREREHRARLHKWSFGVSNPEFQTVYWLVNCEHICVIYPSKCIGQPAVIWLQQFYNFLLWENEIYWCLKILCFVKFTNSERLKHVCYRLCYFSTEIWQQGEGHPHLFFAKGYYQLSVGLVGVTHAGKTKRVIQVTWNG